ncbi:MULTISPECIES: hypothetical protein [Nitrosomonas]|uniref:Uncharacterized protein n=2 Tax=Nitrosomonas communis TaxID=44574 RepID=A0A0F7KJ75_9PROT|nr:MULTISPECIES: hypothetical protein [Nitrosomonas]AKH39168.1 hypothetical protein AAW31_17230 [Nitrosomonas communis]TYP69927.1 hypothetical protein BCL69_11333 [Nitrosomonas communis]UVS61347.1 hypothetical protein NX761_18040 [Nitrosomonas sp. PLL12]
MKLSDDKKFITLSINEKLSANELSTLIYELSLLRAEMLPEVPYNLSVNGDDNMASMQEDPEIFITTIGDNIGLGFRDSGFGWLIFKLPHSQVCNIRDYLTAYTKSGTSDLFISNGSKNLLH